MMRTRGRSLSPRRPASCKRWRLTSTFPSPTASSGATLRYAPLPLSPVLPVLCHHLLCSPVCESRHGHADAGPLLLRDEPHGHGAGAREGLAGGLRLPADGAAHQRPGGMGEASNAPFCHLVAERATVAYLAFCGCSLGAEQLLLFSGRANVPHLSLPPSLSADSHPAVPLRLPKG